MRTAAALVLGPDDGPDAFPPSAAGLKAINSALRGHLGLLIPVVQQAAGPRPKDVQTYCALACVGEARGKLSITPRPTLESRVAHARRLARVLNSLCDHYEQLSGPAS